MLMPKKVKYRKHQRGNNKGSGKSPVDHFSAVIKPGKILFEIGGVDEATARDAFRRADAKLPLKTKFVKDEL